MFMSIFASNKCVCLGERPNGDRTLDHSSTWLDKLENVDFLTETLWRHTKKPAVPHFSVSTPVSCAGEALRLPDYVVLSDGYLPKSHWRIS